MTKTILTKSRSYLFRRGFELMLAGFGLVPGSARIIDMPNGTRYFSVTMRLGFWGRAHPSSRYVLDELRRTFPSDVAAQRTRKVA